ncbi:MAG: recombinase RecA [Thioploca sp.]|nr:recombinase RecA [Thioploca sp.]
MDDSKKLTLNNTLKQIEKQFGKGAVMRLGDVTALDVETVSTGSLGLDIALGVGGLPKGRVVEIYGPEASGKTTLTLQVAAEIQKKGGLVAFIDAEHALDRHYAEKLGINISELYLAQPNNGEEALEITDTLVRSGAFELVVIDSVAALTPKAEIEGDMGDSHMGLQARLMSQALRKLTANISRTNTLVIFINQIRMKIGVMFGCFADETPVVLADGSKESIGNIVTQRLPLKVLSYNQRTQSFESRRIVNWYDNGETDTFWHFKVAAPGSQLYYQFACTANHQLLTPTGYQAAGRLKVGDKLMTMVPFEILTRTESINWNSLPTKVAGNNIEQTSHRYSLWQPISENSLHVNEEDDLVVLSSTNEQCDYFSPPTQRVWRAIPGSIVDIQKQSLQQPEHRFDLEIEGHHNYVVDGVIVHNSPETTTGGNALKFYASIRLEIRRIGGVKRGEEVIGNETRVKVAKNKVAPPFKEAVFDILYGEGVSHESELIELGTQCNVIDKSGAWYSYQGNNLGQGKENTRLYLKEHPELAQTIEEQIRSQLLPPKVAVVTEENTDKSK